MKAKAKTALENETNAAIYAQRKVDVESAFGNIKGDLSFTRFLLRGLKKVRTEFGLVALAHNLRKLAIHHVANFAGNVKNGNGKRIIFHYRLFFKDLLDSPFYVILNAQN